MKDDTCAKATIYADRLMKVRDMAELSLVGAEIKARLGDLSGWEDWLRDIYRSAYDTLKTPNTKFEDSLNSLGKAALKRSEI